MSWHFTRRVLTAFICVFAYVFSDCVCLLLSLLLIVLALVCVCLYVRERSWGCRFTWEALSFDNRLNFSFTYPHTR